VVLPGDRVESAWAASFRQTGDTLSLVPPVYQLTIPPGGRVTEHISASGTTVRPVRSTLSAEAG
jgi:hypothetical protein